ncbi:hypothetical protein [Caviibacterium pharyngocola]|uniref:ACT domain-containing protein n=1 Tax=Caviibacterium pharyngocola TaxID=28159 RepID=A0A2M8RU96_9PAST|nr:hypothetical protein [Caviibacterium pharyngocola]PJG82462.1 hypothetical protein CVP04_08995 [Caviibacterium pharyngocola]
MNKEKYHNLIFFTQNDKIVARIQNFYKKHQIKLIFKSVTTYFHFKSYTFSIERNQVFSEIKALNDKLTKSLRVKSILIIQQNCSDISF